MSFEDNLQSRLSHRGNEPPETDLEYYAKPENYTGSNMLAMQRVAMARNRKASIDVESEELSSHSQSVKKIFDRYQDICSTPRWPDSQLREESSCGSTTSIPPEHRLYVTETRMLTKTYLEPMSREAPQTDAASNRRASLCQNAPTTYRNPVYMSTGRRRWHSADAGSLDPQKHRERKRRVLIRLCALTHLAPKQRSTSSSSDSSSVPSRSQSSQSGKTKLPPLSPGEAKYSLANLRTNGWAVLDPLVRAEWYKMAQERKQKARQKFRHAVKTILILLRWISSLSEKSNEHSGDTEVVPVTKTFTDIANEACEADTQRREGLTFDVSHFKAKKEINISNEVKSILTTPSIARTAEQLQIVLYGLQHLKSFAEYPLHMQEKLCRVAFFQHVPPKRVIIRQGHYAENFYFILSGQAVVRILERNAKTGEASLRTAAVMRKGTSFGELALLHRSRRTATVVSQDAVQLLTIGRDDFFDIFMSGGRPGEVPEHIGFVSGLDFMKDWPTDNLLDHPECCLFHFFKRGVVIVKDSTQSDWIYIVKSGSCQVIKQLKGVVPKARTSQEIENGKPAGQKKLLPRLTFGEPDGRIDTGIRHLHLRPKSSPALECEKFLRRPLSSKESRRTPQKESSPESKSRMIRPSTAGVSRSTKIQGNTLSRRSFNPCPQTRKAHFTQMAKHTNSEDGNPKVSRSASLSRQRTPSRAQSQSQPDPAPPGVGSGPVFVQVEVLKPKDVFGLNTVSFEYDEDPGKSSTVVSLVSNGAECIMLSKKFFIDHSNHLVKQMIRRQVSPYPSEGALQENLQTKVDWEIYKRKLVRDVLDSRTLISTSDSMNS